MPVAPAHDVPAVSVVIPTRNRPASLARLLDALAAQTHTLEEVLVVDASDAPADETALRARHPGLGARVLRCRPHVCAQRNLGIRAATAPFVFLCDDDMEPPPEYIARLAEELRQRPGLGAISGFVSEPDAAGRFATDFPDIGVWTLLWRFVFQLTVWADTARVRAPGLAQPLARALSRRYALRRNTFTRAGWPLVTQTGARCFRTAIYGLGASIVRRSWLLDAPYDERLAPDGVGDNYGIALAFPEPIVVCRDAVVRHHRSPENRAATHDAAFRRTLALHAFGTASRRFSPWFVTWLAWSLAGNTLGSLARGRWRTSAALVAASVLIVAGRNPYLDVPRPIPSDPNRA